jgi:site-specific recombinase XerD
MDKAAQDPLIRSFERHLRAENRSERTIATYLIGLRQADAFLRAHGTTLQAATRADLEAFLADLLTRRTASTAATYYKPLKLLYAWLVEEEEIPADPMRRMKRPMVPDKPVPIVPADGLKRLLRACAGSTFEARRDTALFMLLLAPILASGGATPMRSGDVAGRVLRDPRGATRCGASRGQLNPANGVDLAVQRRIISVVKQQRLNGLGQR